MPTISDWLAALTNDFEVVVSSSQKLIHDVRTKQRSRSHELTQLGKPVPAAKTPVGVPIFQPDLHIMVKPIGLLLSIGLITTPPITNLVDISSTWALVRYIWAFEPRNSTHFTQALRLSEEARRIDFHQKALLSDEIGVGFAHYLMTNYFNAINPADFSSVINDPNIELQQNGKAQPDYIFFNETTGEKYIVECKGTQTSRAESVHQLRRGMEQVWAIHPTNSNPLTRLIIATCMLKHKTVAYVLDPPFDDSEERSLDDNSKYHDSSKYVWEPKGTTFRRNVRLIAGAKMLSYAGLDEDAQKLVPESIQKKNRLISRPIGTRETVKTDLGEFEGTSISVRYRDGTKIDLFKGISSHTREYFLQNSSDKNDSISKEKDISGFYKKYSLAFGKKNNWTKTEVDQTFLTVQSICRDGIILQVTIKGNGST